MSICRYVNVFGFFMIFNFNWKKKESKYKLKKIKTFKTKKYEIHSPSELTCIKAMTSLNSFLKPTNNCAAFFFLISLSFPGILPELLISIPTIRLARR